MASSLRGAHNNLCILDNGEGNGARALGSPEWIGVGIAGCCRKTWKTPGLDGFFTKCVISLGMLLFLLQSTLATEGENKSDEESYESSGISPPPGDLELANPAHPPNGSLPETAPFSIHRAEPSGAAESARGQPAYSSILTILAGTAESPQTLVQSRVASVTSGNQTNQWPSEDGVGRRADPSSSALDTALILSSSTGLNPSMHQNPFPPQVQRSRPSPPLPSAAFASPSSPRDFLPRSFSSSSSRSRSTPSSPATFSLMALFHNHLKSKSIQDSMPARKEHSKKRTPSLPIKPPVESHFFGPYHHFTNKLARTVSTTANAITPVTTRTTTTTANAITPVTTTTTAATIITPATTSTAATTTTANDITPLTTKTFTTANNITPVTTTTTTTIGNITTPETTSTAATTANIITPVTITTATTANIITPGSTTTLTTCNTITPVTTSTGTTAANTITPLSTSIFTTSNTITPVTASTATTTANITIPVTTSTTATTANTITPLTTSTFTTSNIITPVTTSTTTKITNTITPLTTSTFTTSNTITHVTTSTATTTANIITPVTTNTATTSANTITALTTSTTITSTANATASSTPATARIPISVHIFTLSRDTSRKTMEAFRSAVMQTVAGPVKSRSRVHPVTPTAQGEHNSPGSSPAHFSLPMETTVVKNTTAAPPTPSSNETESWGLAEGFLTEGGSHLHVPAPSVRTPPARTVSSVSPPVSGDASQTVRIPSASISHTPPAESFTHSAYSRHATGPAKIGRVTQTNSTLSFIFNVIQRSAAERTLASALPLLPSDTIPALSASPSALLTVIGSRTDSRAWSHDSFMTPAMDALTRETEHGSDLMSLASIPTGRSPAAPVSQAGAMASPNSPLNFSVVSLHQSSTGAEFAHFLRTVWPRKSVSPLVPASPASLKAVLGAVRHITTSTRLLNPTAGGSLSQSAHASAFGSHEMSVVLASSIPFVQLPTDASAKLLQTRNKAITRDLDLVTQASDDSWPTSAMPEELNAILSHGYTGLLSREYASTVSQPASRASVQKIAPSNAVHTHIDSVFSSKGYYSGHAQGAVTSPGTAPGSAKDIRLSRNPRHIIYTIAPGDTPRTFDSAANPLASAGMAIALSTKEAPAVSSLVTTRNEHVSSVLNTPSAETGLHSPGTVSKDPHGKSTYGLPEYSGAGSVEGAGTGIASSAVTVVSVTKPKLAVEESAFQMPPDVSETSPSNRGETETDVTLVTDIKAQDSAYLSTQGPSGAWSTSHDAVFRRAGHAATSPAPALAGERSARGHENGYLPEDASQYRSTVATPSQAAVSVSRATETSAFTSLSSVSERLGRLSSEIPSFAPEPNFALTLPSPSSSVLAQTGQLTSIFVVSSQTVSSPPPAPSDVTSYSSISPPVMSLASSIPSVMTASVSSMSSVPTASFDSVVTEEIMTNDSSADSPPLPSASREADVSSRKNATSSPAAYTGNATAFVQAGNSSEPVASTTTANTTQETQTNVTLLLTTVATSAVTTTTEVARTTPPTTTTAATAAATVRLTTVMQVATTTATEMSTAHKTTTAAPRTSESPPTSTTSTSTTGPKITTPAAGLHTTSPTEDTLQCNITEKLWVKTVLSVHARRNRLDGSLKLSLPKGISQALQKAFNDSSVRAKVQSLTSDSNVTVGYYVVSSSAVYVPSVVVEALSVYGVDKLAADIRQFVPALQSLSVTVAPWLPNPAASLQLRTVLRFVSPGDDIQTCSFVQRMEKRLENAFAEAQSKVHTSDGGLSVQILSSSKLLGSPAVSLIYVVRNGSAALNGTVSSNLLNRLTTELVGYFLFFPPLIIAEPLEYHNLNTSAATRKYWVITVIQDVDNSSLEGNYQSFASLMEQRLAELFMLAHQEGRRFRRAATAGTYTVQMVSIRRVPGPRSPAEMTYYVQLNGVPFSGTSAAKTLTTVDSQTMALTLGYFVQVQAEPVVKDPPSNLWIIAAVLVPIGVVTVVIIIIAAVLCRRNKGDFKTDALGNINSRAKTAYRRDASYYHQPVQGFDYAKQHLGQQGGDEEALPVTQETMILPLPIRDAPLTQERGIYQDGSASKKTLSSEIRKSRLPSEDGSVISNESGKLNSGRGSLVQKVPPPQKMTKEEARKRTVDPYEASSGSLQLISIKPMAAPPTYSHPTSSDRSQDSTMLNGEVSMALKQKSDIEHYRNKLRLKAKRKGYYDFPSVDGGGGGGRSYALRQMHGHHSVQLDLGRTPDPEEERASTYIKSRRRHSQMATPAFRSRQSLSSPGPSATEMDLLVMRERSRRGVRNSGYDMGVERIEETDVDSLAVAGVYSDGSGDWQVKGHSDTSSLSSRPSMEDVRQQVHLLLEEAFSAASTGRSTGGRRHHGPCSPGQATPLSEGVASAPGTAAGPRGGLQWVSGYGPDVHQCSPPRPAFRFTQLPEMAVGSPPPPIPPRTGPQMGSSLRRSSSDIGPKSRTSECSVPELPTLLDSDPYGPLSRVPLPAVTADQSLSHYSGNPITAVYAIPASRAGYPGYFAPTPPSSSYRSPSWMSYPPEPEDLPHQWTDVVPLPGYGEDFPQPRYPQSSPVRLGSSARGVPDPPPTPSTAASQRSLTDPAEKAKLARRQTETFEFQV